MIITHNGTILTNDGVVLNNIITSPSFQNTYSMLFDGMDDYVDLSTSTGLDFSGDFTLSAWVKTSAIGDNQFIIDTSTSASLGHGYSLRLLTTGAVRFWSYDATKSIDSATTLLANTWYHITATHNRSGLENKIYINGVLDVSGVSGTFNPTPMDNLRIGTSALIGFPFNGNIDEPCFFNRIVTPAEIATLSTAPTVDITSLSPIAWLRNGDNGAWKSPQWLIPNNENKDKVSNYSMNFDGNDDNVDCGVISAFQSTANFSISFWLKVPNLAASNFIFSTFTSGSNTIYSYLTTGGEIVFNINNIYQRLSGIANPLTAGQWYNITLVYDGGIPSMEIYIDGVIGTGTPITPPIQTGTNTGNFNIGNITTNYFNGNIDELAIYDYSLTAAEALAIGGTVSTDLSLLATPPTNYYKLGENATYKSPQWLIPANENKDKVSNYSMVFDGVNDYLTIANNTTIGTTQNISYSIWVNLDATTRQYIVGNWGSSNFGGGLAVENGDVLVFQMADVTNDSFFNSRVAGFSTHAPINTWNHILATWDGTDSKIYINGVLRNTWSPTLPYTISYSNTFWIGRRSNNDFSVNGKLDELALFDTAISIGDVWDGSGEPVDASGISGITNYWKMGENATFLTTWTVPDEVGIATGTSGGMLIDARIGDAPGSTNNGLSSNMTIEDRVGTAPSSSNNALSFNMDLIDRVEDTPPTP